MIVPFIDLAPTATLVRQSAMSAFHQVVDRTEFVGGSTVAALEHRLARRLAVRHVVTCASGSDALAIALAATGIGPGKTVAVPNLTFWATYEAVVHVGATPVLVDVNPADLQMDFDQMTRTHERMRLDAVLLVHLMGWATPRLQAFRSFCRENGLVLVEDGAQAFGVEVHGKSVFAGAQVSTISFYPAKVVGGCENGGAILTDDDTIAEAARKLGNHGRTAHYTHTHVGWNSRMGGLQAAWLMAVLDHEGRILSERRRIAQSYLEMFGRLESKVTRLGPPDGVLGNGYLSVCTLKTASLDWVTAELAAAGIQVGRVYPETVDRQPPACSAPRIGDLPNARAFCASVINLPLFFGMTAAQVDYVQTTFSRVLAGASRR